MSEQERGPYTPPREKPLAFDARGARDARPMPMTLIASGVVLVVLIGGVIMAYLGGVHGRGEPAKAVGDKVVSMKTVPGPGQATPSDPASRLEVFTPAGAPPPPAFTPGPEQPGARPKPQLQVQPSTQPSVRIATGDETPTASPAKPLPVAQPLSAADVAAATGRPIASKPAVAVAKPATAPSARPLSSASTASASTSSASTAALKPALSSKPAVASTSGASTSGASTAAAGGVGAQIGAFSSKELADKGFADVAKLASTAGRGKRVEPVAHGTATLYRTTVTGFADRDAARTFCATLTAQGHACIVKG